VLRRALREERRARASLVFGLVAVWDFKGKPAADHHSQPNVGPELIGRRDRRHAITVLDIARRCSESDVEELGDVPRFREENVRYDCIVAEGAVVIASRLLIPGEERDVIPQFEPPTQCVRETARVLIAICTEIFGVAEGCDAQPVEHAVRR
jgi:hypothetical protein